MTFSRLDALSLAARTRWHQSRRLADWMARPAAYPTAPMVSPDGFPHRHGERAVPVARLDPDAEPRLEAGKRVNVALAAPAFDGRLIGPHRPLSFWRTIGRLSVGDGYRHGLELRGGCLVPSVGGGICLLSNAIFALAVELGWSILERHGHTLEAVPPGPGELWGLDATVAWPHVDLRVAPRQEVRLGVKIEGGVLRLSAGGRAPSQLRSRLEALDDRVEERRGERFRLNRILRTVRDGAGGVVEEGIVAVNRRRLLAAPERRRTCLTCDETDCAIRVAEVA